MTTSHWPLFGLRVHTPRVSLQYVDDALSEALASLAAEGIHDPDQMPFTVPWTDAVPPHLQRGALQHYWLMRATWRPDDWHCAFAVLVDGEVVGTQGAFAKDFGVLREATTGSWVGRRFQGRGIGSEMRQAVLHLLFDGLGADYALSGAFEDNAASRAVSAKLPYAQTGRRRLAPRGEARWLVDLRMARDAWLAIRRDDIEIEGLEPCRDLFGLAPSA
jgi:RimJ/RimL family protein N-acetyltransferase